ncbi:MAG TPA: type II secretion system protein GspL [Candidatus Macondimonas sp.]|nr:type II secretion system protein GspL [Candidatus Macondimonas sp.]
MRDGLVHLSVDAAAPPVWWPDGAPIVPGEPRQAAPAVCALAPTSRLLLQPVRVPARRRSALARAVPFALEESLPGEVDDYAFTIGPRQGDGTVPVVAAARVDLGRWRVQLGEVGLAEVPLLPACLALAWEPGCWTVGMGPGGEVSVRTGRWSGWGCEAAVLEPLLRRGLGEPGARPDRLCLVDADALADRLATAWPDVALSRLPPAVGWQVPDAETLAAFRLDGAGGAREDGVPALLRRWRLPLAVAGLWAVLAAAVPAYRAATLEAERARLAEQMVQIYRDTVPDARRVVDPAAQMAQQRALLQRGSGADPLLALLGAISEPLSGLPGYALEELRYQDGALELAVRTDDLAALESLAPRLSQAGVGMSRLSASADADATRTRIRLESRP